MTPLDIFRTLILVLSLSTETTCNAPLARATECWIINNDTGAITVLTPDGIRYEEEGD